MRWILIVLALLATACTINYHDERSNPDSGLIYRIKPDVADSVVKNALVKSLKADEIDAFESISKGYLFHVKRIESKAVLIPVSDSDGAYLGVALDIVGSGGYLSTKMQPGEFQQTMKVIEIIRADLEKGSDGVINRDAKEITKGIYP